jgi:hypothetical protein
VFTHHPNTFEHPKPLPTISTISSLPAYVPPLPPDYRSKLFASLKDAWPAFAKWRYVPYVELCLGGGWGIIIVLFMWVFRTAAGAVLWRFKKNLIAVDRGSLRRRCYRLPTGCYAYPIIRISKNTLTPPSASLITL